MGGTGSIKGSLSGSNSCFGIGERGQCGLEFAGLGESGGSGSVECCESWCSNTTGGGKLSVIGGLSIGDSGACISGGCGGSTKSATCGRGSCLSSSLDSALCGEISNSTVLLDCSSIF
jgi:hypothetical protein